MTIDTAEALRIAELNKRVKAFIDEQLAAGKTKEEIDDMLHDDDEGRHARRVEEEDRERLTRGY